MFRTHFLDDRSAQLQAEFDRLSQEFGVRSMPVGLRTNGGLNVYAGDDGSHHYTFYERGKLGFDQVGGLDDVLYWYCQAERFKYEYQVLSHLNADWAKKNVRELAALFRNGQPGDISLLPDIGEAL